MSNPFHEYIFAPSAVVAMAPSSVVAVVSTSPIRWPCAAAFSASRAAHPTSGESVVAERNAALTVIATEDLVHLRSFMVLLRSLRLRGLRLDGLPDVVVGARLVEPDAAGQGVEAVAVRVGRVVL